MVEICYVGASVGNTILLSLTNRGEVAYGDDRCGMFRTVTTCLVVLFLVPKKVLIGSRDFNNLAKGNNRVIQAGVPECLNS